jgi:hypothetical protein
LLAVVACQQVELVVELVTVLFALQANGVVLPVVPLE